MGATYNNIDTDALTLCEFTAPCEREVAARALRWRLAPPSKWWDAPRPPPRARRHRRNADARGAHGSGDERRGVEGPRSRRCARASRARASAPAGRRGGRPVGLNGRRMRRCCRRAAARSSTPRALRRAQRARRRAGAKAQGFRDTEVARAVVDVAACALAATSSIGRARCAPRLVLASVQDVRRGDRDRLSRTPPAVRLVGAARTARRRRSSRRRTQQQRATATELPPLGGMSSPRFQRLGPSDSTSAGASLRLWRSRAQQRALGSSSACGLRGRRETLPSRPRRARR